MRTIKALNSLPSPSKSVMHHWAAVFSLARGVQCLQASPTHRRDATQKGNESVEDLS
jgi:hypothetical protein